MSVIITLIIFSIIVVIHEWGHMRVAKACGINVEEFAVGMGPKLFGFKKNGTLYSVRLLPLGGFCRMTDESDKEKGIKGFNDANVWQRIAVCVAGPLMNFVLALAVMTVCCMMTSVTSTTVETVSEGTPAESVGLQPGDRIVSINGKSVHIYSDLSYYIAENGGNQMDIAVKRGKTRLAFSLTPQLKADENRYIMGITLDSKAPLLDVGLYKEIPEDMPRANFTETLHEGFWSGIFTVKVTFEGFVKLFAGKVKTDELAGPIGVSTVVGETYETTKKELGMAAVFLSMADITALLSANLGIINLLPIPALDGGRLLIFFVEVIRRKRIPPEKEGMINLAGFAVIMLLGVFIAYNDILKIIRG
ncbi:MAG: site-2 protease family protein [Firmicutes bacterium]|nr:site-2 protease family protein [Bacillota bacterium]